MTSTYCRRDGFKSIIIKRSVIVNGHKTSISLEDVYWRALDEIKAARNEGLEERAAGWTTIYGLVGDIELKRPAGANLSCAIRIFILNQMLAEITALRRHVPGKARAERKAA